MKYLVGAACFAAIAASSAVYASAGGGVPERACEAALKDMLKSPSSYKRVALSASSHEQTLEEYAAPWNASVESGIISADTRDLMLDGFKSKTEKPTVVSVSIDYEAKNSFGVSLRGHAECSYDGSIARIN